MIDSNLSKSVEAHSGTLFIDQESSKIHSIQNGQKRRLNLVLYYIGAILNLIIAYNYHSGIARPLASYQALLIFDVSNRSF